MKFQSIIQSEITQTQEDKHYIVSLIYESWLWIFGFEHITWTNNRSQERKTGSLWVRNSRERDRRTGYYEWGSGKTGGGLNWRGGRERGRLTQRRGKGGGRAANIEVGGGKRREGD